MRKRKPQKPVACKFCGEPNLMWSRHGLKWTLYESSGRPHTCTNAMCPDCKIRGLRLTRVDGVLRFKHKSGDLHVCKTVNDNSVPQTTSESHDHDQSNEGENPAV